ncbi:extracellular endo-alpha-(1-_5)-L-arabinanase [Catenovulum maritimum]|uniref:Extracellular endo-alpha-(1->5)-L-arabinanase n=1 Tax=Catenovulum maritimum TaxID=1513271 RepID=A0A0J8GT19_9ALTE|nr:extracellular endo-alpha-(1->5)-L-arabinanase [Catenovulum maritimum]
MSVHDPSVYQTSVNGQTTYYIFGSFLASAKSTDLMNWTSVSDGVNNNNPLFNYNVTNELAEGFAWTGEQSLWAADVVQLSNGQFAYYYNQSIMTAPRGYTGVATGNSIEGPFYNQGIQLKSGMWGEESENAGEIYDPTIHPNAVDPHTFYDKNGKLWMVYGSYSGGIFILEMDDTTGKPLAGQGYGKHLLGGDHSHIEGAFILHTPDSPYYYMFTSFGGLAADGGYNIRVSRATSPDGPYYDAQNYNMANVAGNRSSIAPYGVKLMGGFEFAGEYGYLSPGHNSAVHNAATGQNFLIFHTRFPNTGEYHSVRVHEMFINSEGWPVVAPQRYVALNGENKVDFNDLLGSYKFINHEKDINSTAKQSINIQLNSDNSISGDISGTWWLQSDNKIQLNINNLGSFNGVASWQWNSATNKLVPTFSALSAAGIAVWGSQN